MKAPAQRWGGEVQTRLEQRQFWGPAKGCILAEELGASEVIGKSAQDYLLKMLKGGKVCPEGRARL